MFYTGLMFSGEDENYMKAKRQRLEGDESIMTRTGTCAYINYFQSLS